MLKSATYDPTTKELTLVVVIDEVGRPPKPGAKLNIHAYAPYTFVPNMQLNGLPAKVSVTVGSVPKKVTTLVHEATGLPLSTTAA